MTTADKKSLIGKNTMLWLVAMVLPAAMSFALASTKFPWQIVVPLLLLGCLMASNRMMAQAIGETTDDASTR